MDARDQVLVLANQCGGRPRETLGGCAVAQRNGLWGERLRGRSEGDARVMLGRCRGSWGAVDAFDLVRRFVFFEE